MKHTVKQLLDAGYAVERTGVNLLEITRAQPFFFCRANKVYDAAAVIEDAVSECGFTGVYSLLCPEPKEAPDIGLYVIEPTQIAQLLALDTMIQSQKEALQVLAPAVNYPKEHRASLKMDPSWPDHPAVKMAAMNAQAFALIQSAIGFGIMKQGEMIADWLKS